MAERDKESQAAMSHYVLNATHFEEEIQKNKSNLIKEQDKCAQVVTGILEHLNRF